eukprot:gene11938-13174_t
MTAKTPSGILNELTKNNNLTINYNPSEESGPPHKKTFRVKVSITGLAGMGTFEGFGQSIKDAKNASANNALQAYMRTGIESMKKHLKISPTVELNILSMRAKEEVVYEELEPVHVKNTLPVSTLQSKKSLHAASRPTLYRQFIKIWKISVTVLSSKFVGQGKTKQEARNNAASNALESFRHELILKGAKHEELSQNEDNVQETKKENESDERTEIFKLNEMTAKLKQRTQYEVMSTSGPAHLMRFRVKCIVGDKETIGDGIGKKAAKLSASKKMLELLNNSENMINLVNNGSNSRSPTPNRHAKTKKKKKVKSQFEIDINSDPITYLTQLLQLRKEPSATFTFLGERGSKIDRKFEMEARLGNTNEFVATGLGSTKKEAKMRAAENLLKICGIDRQELRESENEIKKAYLSAAIGMPRTASEPSKPYPVFEEKPPVQQILEIKCRAPGGPVNSRINLQQPTDVAQFNPVQKLELIATSERLKTLYNDYAKKTDTEPFSTDLAVFTTPPMVFQGVGKSIEHAHDDAASQALDYLTKHGFPQSKENAKSNYYLRDQGSRAAAPMRSQFIGVGAKNANLGNRRAFYLSGWSQLGDYQLCEQLLVVCIVVVAVTRTSR